MNFKHMFLLVSVPYLVIIFYNQVEYSNLKKQVASQESAQKAELLLEHANFVTRQNSLFLDAKLQMYYLNRKYREEIIFRLKKSTETVQNYTQAYSKAYETMDLTRIGALQSNINKKIEQLENIIEEAKWIFETNKQDLELKFVIQKGIHAIAEANVSF